jgi:hypothetical protein
VVTGRDKPSVVTTTKLTVLQEARQDLQKAARQFSEAPDLDPNSRFGDLFLRRAAIMFTRELTIALLGFHNTGLEDKIDELMHLAEASLKAPGSIRDVQIGRLFREYRARWHLR